MIAPNVAIYTAIHPINPIERNNGIEYAKKVIIGDNCWLGGNSIICYGVILSNNVVAGSGAVVT